LNISIYLDIVPTPTWLDPAHTAWQLVAATLVGLMSVPGLAILYSGLMKRKWALNSALMVLYAFGATLVVWSFWAYKMSFGAPLTVWFATSSACTPDDRPALNAEIAASI